MRNLVFVAGLLLMNLAGLSPAQAEEFEAAALSNESLVSLSVSGRCVRNTNQLTVEWGGTASKFEIFYNGRILDTRTSPGVLIFNPGTRVSKISIKACKNAVCDTDTQTWNGSDCGRPGTPNPL